MIKARILQILSLGSQFGDYRKHMTPEEIKYVLAGWQVMPGATCFYDALVRAAKQQHPFDPEGLLADVLHVLRGE